MVPHHPQDEVLLLQQSLRVQLERALFPWDPLQFFESSLAPRVYLSGPLSVSCFFFSRVCAHAEGSFLESALSYHVDPLIQFGSSNLVASAFTCGAISLNLSTVFELFSSYRVASLL